MKPPTIVHLVRHGEVENPTGILYGRLPNYHLSQRGQQMATQLRDYFVMRDIVRVVSSPLERAQETATPLARELGLPIVTDDRLLEATNVFEGQRVGVGDGVLRKPASWRHLYNPFRPSWGEPYQQLAQRVLAAVADAAQAAPEQASVLVSHQLPIWIARLKAENRRLWHDPRRRQCALASVTSFHYDGGRLLSITYAEPCAQLARDAHGRGA